MGVLFLFPVVQEIVSVNARGRAPVRFGDVVFQILEADAATALYYLASPGAVIIVRCGTIFPWK